MKQEVDSIQQCVNHIRSYLNSRFDIHRVTCDVVQTEIDFAGEKKTYFRFIIEFIVYFSTLILSVCLLVEFYVEFIKYSKNLSYSEFNV